jgi:hypothetical protein
MDNSNKEYEQMMRTRLQFLNTQATTTDSNTSSNQNSNMIPTNTVINQPIEPIQLNKATSEVVMPVTNLSKTPSIETAPTKSHSNPNPPVKQIDKEHVIIEKVFRISLTESDKFAYLELYHAQLISMDQPEAFRIKDLDNIIIAIIDNKEKRPQIINYLLETYHRCIEMIERRYKNELDERYHSIRQIIASYLGLIITTPEMFELSIKNTDVIADLTKFINDTDDEEVDFLFTDIIRANVNNPDTLKQAMRYVFNILHLENMKGQNFYHFDKIRRHLGLLIKLLNDNPIVRELYTQEGNFLTKGINGKAFHNTFLGVMLGIVSFEADPQTMKSTFSSVHHNEAESQVRIQYGKLNKHIDDLRQLVNILIESPESSENLHIFFYELISANFERLKMYSNPFTTSSIGK